MMNPHHLARGLPVVVIAGSAMAAALTGTNLALAAPSTGTVSANLVSRLDAGYGEVLAQPMMQRLDPRVIEQALADNRALQAFVRSDDAGAPASVTVPTRVTPELVRPAVDRPTPVSATSTRSPEPVADGIESRVSLGDEPIEDGDTITPGMSREPSPDAPAAMSGGGAGDRAGGVRADGNGNPNPSAASGANSGDRRGASSSMPEVDQSGRDGARAADSTSSNPGSRAGGGNAPADPGGSGGSGGNAPAEPGGSGGGGGSAPAEPGGSGGGGGSAPADPGGSGGGGGSAPADPGGSGGGGGNAPADPGGSGGGGGSAPAEPGGSGGGGGNAPADPGGSGGDGGNAPAEPGGSGGGGRGGGKD